MPRLKSSLAILFLICNPLVWASDDLLERLEPSGFVNDFAGVISPAQEQKLGSMIMEVRQKTGAEIAVVTLSSLEGGEIDDFTNRLFEKWGVGQKGKDNGLMFLAAMQDRKMRIEVGYGLEGAIPDAKAGRIRRDVFTPHFKAGKPGRGIVEGIAALSVEILKGYGAESDLGIEPPGFFKRIFDSLAFQVIAWLCFVAILAVLGYYADRHSSKRSGYRGGTSARRGFYHGDTGGYSGGFGGGSGGGFGGGCSGGGGSSGGW